MERAASIGSFLLLGKGESHIRTSHASLNSAKSRSFLQVGKLRSASSIGYHGDIDTSLSDPSDEDQPTIKSYKRRFFILFIYSTVSFLQYLGWNTFGPISSSCMYAFDWTESEIALMASLDPITYLLTIFVFSWLMDVKGLRVSMLITIFVMTLGNGLRCITSENKYVTWTMALGQFFNGIGGPVTQAAPPLISAKWFPTHERTTATAVAALCGSLGVAMSFIIGPIAVKDASSSERKLIDTFENVTSMYRQKNMTIDGPQYFADTIFRDASHYWPLDKNSKGVYIDFKSGSKNARVIGSLKNPYRVKGTGIKTDKHKGWLSLGNFQNACFSDPLKCDHGLTTSFWIKLSNTTGERQYLLGTGNSQKYHSGFLIYRDKTENYSLVTVQLSTGKKLWTTSFVTLPLSWFQTTMTWNKEEGLKVFTNGSLSAMSYDYIKLNKKQTVTSNLSKEFTVGRIHDEELYSAASFDEIALWERILSPGEIKRLYYMTAGLSSYDKEKFNAELHNMKKERKREIMRLLYAEFAANAILLLVVFIYFPEKPPTPPSISAHTKREDFIVGAKKLIRNKQFWTLCMIYGTLTGVYSGWGAVLNVNLASFGITQKDAGWLGFYTVLAGITAGMLLARCADLLSGRMKKLLLVLFIGSTGCFLWFCLLCLRIISYSKGDLYKSAILGGFFVSGTIPLFYELTIEQTYPVAEGTTTGLLTLVNNIVTVLFLVVLIIPKVGTLWMNWALFGSCAVCLPVLVSFKENYNRLQVDLTVENDKCADASSNRYSDWKKKWISQIKTKCFSTKFSMNKALRKSLKVTHRRDPFGKNGSLYSLPNIAHGESIVPEIKNLSESEPVKENDQTFFLHTPAKLCTEKSNSIEEKRSEDSVRDKRKVPIPLITVNEPNGTILQINDANELLANRKRCLHLPVKL